MVASNDFSHFALWLAGLATLAQAYTTPVGANPSGNPISKPGLNEIVPAGTPYTITWSPTTESCGSVDLVLLRGPSDNIKPLSAIAEGVANTGTYTWTPAATLEPDTTHYGIQLICDQSGAYQYTTQFGISNPAYSPSWSSWSSSASASASASVAAAGVTSTRSVHLAVSSSSMAPSSSPSSSSAPASSSTSPLASASFPVPGNSTVAHATGTVVHTSLKTSAKPHTSTKVETLTNTPTSTVANTPGGGAPSATTQAPTGTNAAGVARAAFGLMGGAAALVAFAL